VGQEVMSLWKLANVAQDLADLLDGEENPSIEEVRPLVHQISELYLNWAFEEYNKSVKEKGRC